MWIGFGAFVHAVAPGARLGLQGTILVIYAVVTLIAWQFVRRYKRQLASKEIWILTGACTCWAVGLESVGMLYALGFPEELGFPVSPGEAMYSVAFAAATDALLLFAGFKLMATRLVHWYLQRGHSGAA